MRPRSRVLHRVPALLILFTAGWATAAAVEDGSHVGSEACLECHEMSKLALEGNVHLRIEPFEARGRQVGCEGCHGPGSDGRRYSIRSGRPVR